MSFSLAVLLIVPVVRRLTLSVAAAALASTFKDSRYRRHPVAVPVRPGAEPPAAGSAGRAAGPAREPAPVRLAAARRPVPRGPVGSGPHLFCLVRGRSASASHAPLARLGAGAAPGRVSIGQSAIRPHASEPAASALAVWLLAVWLLAVWLLAVWLLAVWLLAVSGLPASALAASVLSASCPAVGAAVGSPAA